MDSGQPPKKISVTEKLKYNSNITKNVDYIIIQSIHKGSFANNTCGFNHNIQQNNGGNQQITEENMSF